MRTVIAIAFAALFAAASAPAQTSWKLLWSDEFNGPAGSQPDATYWTYDLGNNGWGNQELENYTNAAENAHMDGLGHLDIHVENRSPGVDPSARRKTEGLFPGEYAPSDARTKLPIAEAIGPAFWMLGKSVDLGGRRII